MPNFPSILFLTPYTVESASERYRIYQFLPYLEKARLASVVRPFATATLFRAIQEERLLLKVLHTPFCIVRRAADITRAGQFDAVLIHREAFPFLCPRVEKMILKRNSKLVFSFDDAVHLGHQDVGNHKYPLVYKLKYGPGINAILTECTHVIAGSQTLANHALQFNPHVTVIPTVVDLERYPIGPPRRPDGAITIGWVGSRSTSPYLLELESVLQRLSRAHPGKLRFRLYGDAKRHLDLPRSESFPFRLATEIEDLRSLDIGLMPIPDNGWTRGKCAFKAIQYMALGIPVVASPVGMAAEVVKHNVNGFLARTAEEWFAALDKLVREADLRERLGASGRATVEERYSLQRWGPVFARLLRDVVECRQPQTVGRHALTTV